MKIIENVAAALFGVLFLILGFAVAAETIMRKVFNKSLQGVDELGGYILAAGAALAFAVALAGRAHIRIDIVHYALPRLLRVVLNVVSVAALTTCALVAISMAWIAYQDSVLFNATAQTPWATPLKYPQAVWVGALAVFVLACLVEWWRLGVLAIRDGAAGIDRRMGPRTSREDLEEELADIRARGTIAGVPGEETRP
jgi:TRAP-type C4-dicarboxylate transport system permease small subunit